MMRQRKAVFLDIDGTLLLNGQGPFKDDLDQIEKTSAQGHRVFLSTGRALANIPARLLECPFFSGISAGTGTHVLLSDSTHAGHAGTEPETIPNRYKTIYHKWVPGDLVAAIISWYAASRRCCILEGESRCFAVNSPSRSYTVDEPLRITSEGEFIRNYPDEIITKLTIDGSITEEEIDLLEQYFQINTFPDYSEAIIKGESKAKSMDLILTALGIRREDSIAIGDSVNDLDMIRHAGLGIAMGNACTELKAAAGAVTGNCGSGGVAEALKRCL
ncbi:MAG: HAD-IIB family hydrolase [Treponema sp.]|jgi:HAD superfamily hydrolase (TIGR01484 family)|nr:HAD-IIB family hydrolase [Treponema sp.]